jgi:hypothetical protein
VLAVLPELLTDERVIEAGCSSGAFGDTRHEMVQNILAAAAETLAGAS